MKVVKILIGIFCVFQLTGCSLAFLVSKNQNVTIVKDSLTTLQINKKSPVIKNDKYVLPRNGEAQQVVLSRPDYKDQYMVCVPYKFSGMGVSTVVFNVLMLGIPATSFAVMVGGGPFMTLFSVVGGGLGFVFGSVAFSSPKFWDYDRTIYMNDPMLLIPIRDSVTKEIRLNKVAVNLSPDSTMQYWLSYKDYKKGMYKKQGSLINESDVKLEDTYFSDELNELLAKNGYIDTTGYVLKSNYNQNAYLNATIIGYRYFKIPNRGAVLDDRKTGFIKIGLTTKWDVLDYYRKTLYSDTIMSNSGEYVSYVKEANSNYQEDALKDAIETSLYTLLNSDRFKKSEAVTEVVENDTFDTLEIENSKAFVANIGQAVKASLTIKTQKGHGSGFFVSDNGYIITNYHVIADTAKLEVILNDGTKYKPIIIRYNKEFDVALLKINKKGIVPFKVSRPVSIGLGKEIYAIGTPSAQDLSQTLTKGIISSIRKQENGTKLIQTDASVSFGNSGGPLIDKEGNLLGIVDAKLVGRGVEGISFAIPANELMSDLKLKIK